MVFMLFQVEHQEYVLEFWRKSLNSLTWPEILRQVLVAAGFGSKEGPLRRVANKVFFYYLLNIKHWFNEETAAVCYIYCFTIRSLRCW